MVLVVIFWILLLLCAIGTFVPEASYPLVNRGRFVTILIMIAILGWKVIKPT